VTAVLHGHMLIVGVRTQGEVHSVKLFPWGAPSVAAAEFVLWLRLCGAPMSARKTRQTKTMMIRSVAILRMKATSSRSARFKLARTCGAPRIRGNRELQWRAHPRQKSAIQVGMGDIGVTRQWLLRRC